MPLNTEHEAIAYIFRSRYKLQGDPRGLDELTRDISHTRRLLMMTGLPAIKREYAVVTGSKGKGSTTTITAKVLQALGHRVGMMTSPHLVSWYERIRINGRSIPQADFLRILNDFVPHIDQVESSLSPTQYLSPQGIFLLIALRWFDEQEVTAAVLEVGRGGRYDDISLVPNMISLFTPIFMEHAQYLGNSLERIAWHKSGIIKEGGFAYSVPQSQEVLDMIQREADTKQAQFYWFPQHELGEYLGDTPDGDGIRFKLQRYGECDLPLLGRYQVENATLAIQAAGNMHNRLNGIPHNSEEYVTRIKQGLAAVRWFGRLQKLQDAPQVYVEGAINVKSARAFLESVAPRQTAPVIIITGVPQDRDFAGVYEVLAKAADALILTETQIHPNIHFPDPQTALNAARQYHSDVSYTRNLTEALDVAYRLAGSTGTILLSVAQPLVGEAMLIWQVPTDVI